MTESFQPIAIRAPSDSPAMFAVRCAVDLQLLTIFQFLRTELAACRGRVLDVGAGESPWRELLKTHAIIGTPLLEIHTRFLKAATYGETLEIHTAIESWAAKTFAHRHQIKRGEELICEGTEVRAFVIRDPGNPERLKAIPIPEDIRALCS